MPDPPLPRVFRRSAARAVGLTDRQIDAALSTGRWRASRRGLLTVEEGRPARSPIPSEWIDIAAALRSVAGGTAVASHTSAARFWALPQPLAGWGEITLTVASGSTRRRNGVHVHVAALPDGDVVSRGTMLMTSLERTVADCLRTLTARDALATADAAVHSGRTTAADVEHAVRAQAGWPGCRRARQVLALVDGRRESPLESWSAWAFAVAGLPQPHWQIELRTRHGTFVARTDAWWPEGLAGEADGRSKYALQAAERGGVSAEVLLKILEAERLREQHMRNLGAEIIRWGARDVLSPHPASELTAHTRELLRIAEKNSRFDGKFTLP